jgi:hypothetical protein
MLTVLSTVLGTVVFPYLWGRHSKPLSAHLKPEIVTNLMYTTLCLTHIYL